MFENLTPYIDPISAKRLNFRGCCIVTRVGGQLEQYWQEVKQSLLDKAPSLAKIVTFPQPHMTFCWPEALVDDNILLAILQSWADHNLPFDILCDRVKRYPGISGIPYLRINPTPNLRSKRMVMIRLLEANMINIQDRVWKTPHVSLFYYLSQPTIETSTRIQASLLEIPVKHSKFLIENVELVWFLESGNQVIRKVHSA